MSTYLYVFGSVSIISLIALVGVVALALTERFLKRSVFYLVSFAAGAMFGDAFIHLIPHTAKNFGITHFTGLYLILGLVISFIVESFIHWHHSHHYGDECEECVDPEAYMIIIGDSVHNFIDGVVIAASYLASIPVGLATTFAVFLHEFPQEIGDFGVLVHGGFSRLRAVFYNFLSALTSFMGAGLVLFLSLNTESMNQFLLPMAAGGFIYIAGSDLIPQVKDRGNLFQSLAHISLFILGAAPMYFMTFL